MTTPFDVAAFIVELQLQAQQQDYPEGTADRRLAQWLDSRDALAPLRQEYYLPSVQEASTSSQRSHDQVEQPATTIAPGSDEPLGKKDRSQSSVYMCGNSLGPLAKRSKRYIEEELDAWSRRGVLGHFDHPYHRPWVRCEERVSVLMSDIVGAKPSEVVAMGTLTSNLHTMLATFYRPHSQHLASQKQQVANPASSQSAKSRHKIIHEAAAFPSDQYALASAVALAGYDPVKSLVPLHPKLGERILHTDDVLAILETEAATGELALIMLGDVQYLTGQMFDVSIITRRARELGVIVGWDLAHAFANVPLSLHDWDVDFAVWCTYKYGSSGPGGIAGAFVHERWGDIGFSTCIGRESSSDSASRAQSSANGLPRPAGWWGHEKSTRFAMPDSFKAIRGAAGWQQSNPSALDCAALLGSLETLALAPGMLEAGKRSLQSSQSKLACPPDDFGTNAYASRCNASTEAVGWGYIMPALRQKSQCLTAYLEHLLTSCDAISVVTPSEARFRGSQLSLCVTEKSISEPVRDTEHDMAATDANDEPSQGLPAPVAGQTFVSRVHRRIETEHGLICDVRNPDMLRVAPVAQFSSFDDVWRAADAIRQAVGAELSFAGKRSRE